MAYPNYYPVGYQSYQMFPTQMSGTGQQPQTTGFIRVPHEDVARNWNVPPGMSLTFIDENSPYCYIKTAGMSQFDRPKFEKYRLVKEEDVVPEAPQASRGDKLNTDVFIQRSEFEALQGRVEALERGVSNESVDGK